MLKTKQTKVFLVSIIMFSMMAMYGFVPLVANAGSLTSAKDMISDSVPSASSVTHTITFRPGIQLETGTVITLVINALIDITNATGTCPTGALFASTTNQVTCTVGATAVASTSDSEITILNATNPGVSDSYDITISHNEGAGESSEMLIYIIDQVTVSAHVDASLTFAVGTTTDGVDINGGDTTTGTGTPTAVNFGTVSQAGGREIIAQNLTVSTNATAGFVVTVQQDNALGLVNGAGADIDATSTDQARAWTAPEGTLALGESSYGHWALTSTDTDYFVAQTYQGLDGLTPMTVLSHTGPADGATVGSGQAYVGYSLQVTDLQEAGDYSVNLTYICTPTF